MTCYFRFIKRYAEHGDSTTETSGDTKKQFESHAEQTRLHNAGTISSNLKIRTSNRIDEIWEEIDDAVDASKDDEETHGGETESVESAGKDAGRGSVPKTADSLYDMACVRRYISGREPTSKFVAKTREMFLLKVRSASVKLNQWVF